MSDLDAILTEIDGWGADHAVAAVVRPLGVAAIHGDADHVFRWASLTKIATALTVLIAVEGDLLDLDGPAGPPGSTVRHLLAHASGLTFEGATTLAAPGTRRIYSNSGYDLLGELVASRSARPFEAVMRRSVLTPLGMSGTRSIERPSQGLHGPIGDLIRLATELLQPTLVSASTFDSMTTVAFPGLIGLLPGVGRFEPLDWGLGPELHDGKAGHWMADANSPATFGHFGGAGTFVWVDPTAQLAVTVLTDREYGPWALEAWSAFSGRILSASS